MDSLSRLMWFAAGLMIAALPMLALADDYPAQYAWAPSTAQHLKYSTPVLACQKVMADLGRAYGGVNQISETMYHCLQSSNPSDWWGNATRVYDCPHGGTVSGTICTAAPSCPTGHVRDQVTGQCALNCTSGSPKTGYVPSTSSAGTVCFGGCSADLASADDGHAVDGVRVIYGRWNLTGSACTGAEAEASTGEPDLNCPAGKVPGTFNGQTICLDPGPTNPSETVTTTKTVNSDGTVTTTTTTTHDDGTTTTTSSTTSTSGPGGSGTSTTTSSTPSDSDEEDADDFCEQNPTSHICVNRTASANACAARTAASVQCDGDAIACEILKKQAELTCALHTEVDPITTLADNILAGNDPKEAEFPWNDVDEQDLSGAIKQDKFLGGGFIDDVVFEFKGESFTLPFSQYQNVLEIMGSIFVGVALVVAARIVTG